MNVDVNVDPLGVGTLFAICSSNKRCQQMTKCLARVSVRTVYGDHPDALPLCKRILCEARKFLSTGNF